MAGLSSDNVFGVGRYVNWLPRHWTEAVPGRQILAQCPRLKIGSENGWIDTGCHDPSE